MKFKLGDCVVYGSQKVFVVERKTKQKGTGALMLWDRLGASYLASDCQQAAKVGDVVQDVPSGHHASVVKIDGNLAMIQGDSICGWVPLADLRVVDTLPVSNETPALLDQHALTSLLAAVEAMIASGCYELDLLEALTQGQKRQLWGSLSKGQRDALVSAKEGRKAA